VPPLRARGTARGRLLTGGTGPAPAAEFRCSLAAEDRADELAGTATHLVGFLLVEHHGPWGRSAPADSRLPDEVKQHLRLHPSIKVLMVRRHLRAHRGTTYRVLLALPRRAPLLASSFEDPRELLDLDLDGIIEGRLPDWEPHPGPVFGVCTHGRHDACCAERGRPVAEALCAAYPEETWEVSHMGGDRFSANVVVLPEGLYYGRVDPQTAPALAATHLDGRLDLDHLRGRTTLPMALQYAEVALRRHLDEDRLDAVRLVRREGLTGVFRHEGTDWEVVVRRRQADPARLTCGVERLSPVPVHEVASLRRL
jgi:(2Fe-2S) ferredoxin